MVTRHPLLFCVGTSDPLEPVCAGRDSHAEGIEQNATQFLNSVRGLAARQGCRRNQFAESKECQPRSRPKVPECRLPTDGGIPPAVPTVLELTTTPPILVGVTPASSLKIHLFPPAGSCLRLENPWPPQTELAKASEAREAHLSF